MDIERELAYAVVDAFEHMLDEKGIEIPCADHFEEEERHHEGNASKKTIKRIDRMLKSRCKEHRTFGNALKMYIFRNPTEIGLDYVTFCGKAGYFIGVSLDESGEYNFFGIYSPEQIWEVT